MKRLRRMWFYAKRTSGIGEGWQPDPLCENDLRLHTRRRWTRHTMSFGDTYRKPY